MPLASNIIISDTSCLILLDKIEELGLLKSLSSKVYVTSIILEEYGKQLPNWILIKNPDNKHYQRIFEMDLDRGEASAIALCIEDTQAILIIDDLKGRKVAEKLNIRYSGTFGLILRAKQVGIIEKVKPILDKIRLTNFRFSEKLYESILEEAKE